MSGPSCHNPNLVLTPSGDLGLSSSGPVSGVALSSNARCAVGSMMTTALSATLPAFTTDMPLVTT